MNSGRAKLETGMARVSQKTSNNVMAAPDTGAKNKACSGRIPGVESAISDQPRAVQNANNAKLNTIGPRNTQSTKGRRFKISQIQYVNQQLVAKAISKSSVAYDDAWVLSTQATPSGGHLLKLRPLPLAALSESV